MWVLITHIVLKCCRYLKLVFKDIFYISPHRLTKDSVQLLLVKLLLQPVKKFQSNIKN